MAQYAQITVNGSVRFFCIAQVKLLYFILDALHSYARQKSPILKRWILLHFSDSRLSASTTKTSSSFAMFGAKLILLFIYSLRPFTLAAPRLCRRDLARQDESASSIGEGKR